MGKTGSKTAVIFFLTISVTFMMAAAGIKTFYGEFADIVTTNAKTAFIRSYLLMDCCEEWEDFCNLVISVEDASSAEGLEYYEYNKKGRQLAAKSEITIRFHPTEEFASKPYDDILVYSLTSGSCYEAQLMENGDIETTVKESGIFAFVKISGNPAETVWISNIEDCQGECRSCSDDW